MDASSSAVSRKPTCAEQRFGGRWGKSRVCAPRVDLFATMNESRALVDVDVSKSTLRPAHTGRVIRCDAKNGYLLHYLRSAAPAALCVNTLTDNTGFHKLHYVTQTLRCALCTLCGRGVTVHFKPEGFWNGLEVAKTLVLLIKTHWCVAIFILSGLGLTLPPSDRNLKAAYFLDQGFGCGTGASRLIRIWMIQTPCEFQVLWKSHVDLSCVNLHA